MPKEYVSLKIRAEPSLDIDHIVVFQADGVPLG